MAHASSSSDYGQTNTQLITPGYLPEATCQVGSTNVEAKIVNETGFAESREVYFSHRISKDYYMSRGNNATLEYVLQNGSPSDLREENMMFFHDEGKRDHPGLDVHFSPSIKTANGYYMTTITFMTSQITPMGAYWVVFPPSFCNGASVILLTIGNSSSPNLHTPSPFTVTMNKLVYLKNDTPMIKMTGNPYDLVNLQIFNDSNIHPMINKTIMIDPDGSSSYFLYISGYLDGMYHVVISNANVTKTLSFHISEGSSTNHNSTPMLLPLKQFKSYTAAKDVKCNQGFQLVIKLEDNSPACVKPETKIKLIERGWGITPNSVLTKIYQ